MQTAQTAMKSLDVEPGFSLPDPKTLPSLKGKVSAEEWRLFSRTGVTHLMSISGLHVTMVYGLFAWLAGWLWRRSPFPVLPTPRKLQQRTPNKPRPRRQHYADLDF